MSLLDYEPNFLPRAFPKIVVLCGADTDLGQYLLRELIHSPEIDKVHAITSVDIPSLNRLPTSLMSKVRVHLLSIDNLHRALARIDEADLAFCCLSTDKHAYDAIGRTRFRTLNVDAPKRFVRKMFELGVLYVSVLSHAKADSSSSTDMYRYRGELEDSVRKLRRDAGDFSPFISMFKVSSMAANASSRPVSPGRHSPGRHRRERDALAFRDVARAMRVDAVQKSVRRSDPACKKGRAKYEELYSKEINGLVAEARREDETKPFWQY